MRLSNTQRDLYLLCPKKYYFRYVRKMRSKEKGSALFFGRAFDDASDILFHERDLEKANQKFTDIWMANEHNYNCKFSKSDMEYKVLTSYDLSKLTAATTSLNNSKAMKEFNVDGDVVKLIKNIKKVKESSYARDLTDEEEKYLHYAHILSMYRKGLLMLESFYTNILPHVTEVIGTQVKVDIPDGQGNTIIGYIDVICKMEGYTLPNGRVLTKDDIVVGDVKTAGATYWKKLDHLDKSDQLDTYLASPQVQQLQETNLVSYMAVAKKVSVKEDTYCTSCGHEKTTSHKTCNAEVDGKRCGAAWDVKEDLYCEHKIVIGERDLGEASQIYQDYDDVLHGVKNQVFPRNRSACDAFGGVCEYSSVCGKCLTAQQLDDKIENWKANKGE